MLLGVASSQRQDDQIEAAFTACGSTANMKSCKLHFWRLPHVQRQRSRQSLAQIAAAAAFLLPFLGLRLQQVQEVSAQVCVLKQCSHKVGNFLGAAVSTAGLG
jgi:hypothetical protein